MIVSILAALLLIAIAGLVILVGILANMRLALARALEVGERQARAISAARGFLYNLTSTSIPGASEGAIRVLDDIDRTIGTKEVE